VIFKLDRGGDSIILSLYVDDGLCATNNEALYTQFLSDLSSKFQLSDQGELNWYLGVAIDHNLQTGATTLSQETFIETLLKRFQLEGINTKTTPSEPNTHLLKADQPVNPDKATVRLFQQMVGSLMYLACFTRPDIAYSVNQCAKYMANPGPSHVQAAKRILAYLKGTKDKKLTYTRSLDPTVANVLSCYADSDHAGDPDSRRSVTGFVCMLNGGAVSWQSVRQQVVALSSAEAEYYAASVAGTDVTYIRRFLDEVGYPQGRATVLHEDNMACIYMSRSAAMYHKARHIDTRVYHLREMCRRGEMVCEKIASVDQVADSLTKATPRPLFAAHCDVMLGHSALHLRRAQDRHSQRD